MRRGARDSHHGQNQRQPGEVGLELRPWAPEDVRESRLLGLLLQGVGLLAEPRAGLDGEINGPRLGVAVLSVVEFELGEEIFIELPDAHHCGGRDLLVAPAAWYRLGKGKQKSVQEPVPLEAVAVRREFGEDPRLYGTDYAD